MANDRPSIENNRSVTDRKAWFPSKPKMDLAIFTVLIAGISVMSYGAGLITAFLVWVMFG